MDIANLKKGLHDLFPLFHIKNNSPVEYVFDLQTQEVLASFLLLENIDYGYNLYVKIDMHTGYLSECYPVFYKDFETSIDRLNGKLGIGLKNYFSLPIKYENGVYSFDKSDSYSIYYPNASIYMIRRKRDGVVERTYLRGTQFSDFSFPLYWKIRDLIINSDPDYFIFYFQGTDTKKPDKVLLGFTHLNESYAKVSQLQNALMN